MVRRIMVFIGLALLTLLLVEVIALFLLKRSIDSYASYWQEQAVKQTHDTAITYVALGDSTAQAIGATSPDRGYVGLLAASIEQKTNKPVKVINISKSGARLKDCIDKQLPLLKDLNPDVVTIEIGANDMSDFDEEVFSRDMGHIMDALPPHTVISDMPYFGGGRHSEYEESAVKANKIVRELASSRQLQVASLHRETKQNDNINTYAADFFHPSNAGYKNWHNAFWKVLEPKIK